MRRVFLLLAIGVSLPAQQAPQVQSLQTQPPPSGSVTGHIFCADTHAPARFARVSLVRLRDTENLERQIGVMFSSFGGPATTDMEGAFAIPHVAPGTYALQVDLAGYLDPTSVVDMQDWMKPDPQVQANLRSALPTVTIRGAETASLDASLERGATLSGKVLFDDGSVASGIAMQLMDAPAVVGPGGSTARHRAGLHRSYFTDDQGNFRISSIPPGDYVAAAAIQIQRMVPLSTGRSAFQNVGSSQTIYAPGSFRKKNANIIKVSGTDEKSGITITIPTRGMHFVAGTVIQQENGMPVTGGNVQMVDEDDPTFMLNGQIAPDGSFRIDFVTPGQYTLRVMNAFERPQADSTGPHRISHHYGTTQASVIVASGDATGITLQVPALEDPTKPPPIIAPVRSAANPK
ncbi:hypothetical protein AB4Y89_07595 [Terriglobus sp. 2YAB30_2]|uniref:hypothetical protein n=1 Tax=unclassified Terriglobus TaxID=2628988 RepID=UPI003F9922BA